MFDIEKKTCLDRVDLCNLFHGKTFEEAIESLKQLQKDYKKHSKKITFDVSETPRNNFFSKVGYYCYLVSHEIVEEERQKALDKISNFLDSIGYKVVVK